MRVLVACEESQRVCMAFREKGHEAYSCDIQPCSGGHPEWHIRIDVLKVLNGGVFVTEDTEPHNIEKWDLIIGHPPCTYLSNAGARFLYLNGKLNQERYKKGLKAKEFLWQFIMLIALLLRLKILYQALFLICHHFHKRYNLMNLDTHLRKKQDYG